MQQNKQHIGELCHFSGETGCPSPNLSLLSVWKELAKYHTATCGLIHEKVTEVRQNDHSVREGDQPGLIVTRVGFCSPEVRKWRLSCAHSNAMFNFVRLLRKLEDSGLLLSRQLPIQQISDLCTEIYLLDHHKGDLEKRLAILQWQQNKSEEGKILSVLLEETIKKHHHLTNEVGMLLQSVLQKVEQLFLSCDVRMAKRQITSR